jgi:hypothetical protein
MTDTWTDQNADGALDRATCDGPCEHTTCAELRSIAAERIKVGDFVRVSSGPAYVKGGRAIKGRVEEITPWEGTDDGEVMVRVASGGLWGFNLSHLTKLEKRAPRD